MSDPTIIITIEQEGISVLPAGTDPAITNAAEDFADEIDGRGLGAFTVEIRITPEGADDE